ncbi:hypothetical protein [Streptomyces sp. NPDC058731]|uniref:hypothetical protein n=1 Tax=Streptomyces sp. NPDC058731 TaxID=3346613 RepID=UPI00367E2468
MFAFELEPFREKRRRGRRGRLGAFGDVLVEAERRKPSVKAGSSHLEVRLSGTHMPEVFYRTTGPFQATMKNAVLTVDGATVQLSFNDRAFRNSTRALRFSHMDRMYEYAVIGFGKGATLHRPGVGITLTRGKSAARRGTSTLGAATGDFDALDLALALVFEEVDTAELTTVGAMSKTLDRILNPGSNEPSAE